MMFNMYESDQVTNKSMTNHYGLFSILIVFLFAMGIVFGGVYSYSSVNQTITSLQSQIVELSSLSESRNVTSVKHILRNPLRLIICMRRFRMF